MTTAAALVLGAAAGIRAYLPLLALGLAARAGLIPLQPGARWVMEPPLLAGLGALALMELLADKVPRVDHLNDLLHTAVRPLAGAVILAAAADAVSRRSLPAAVVLGLALAGGAHAVKASSRPLLTALAGGAGGAASSLAEDAVVALLLVLAVLLPWAGLGLLAALAALALGGLGRLRARRRRRAQA